MVCAVKHGIVNRGGGAADILLPLFSFIELLLDGLLSHLHKAYVQ